MSVEMKLGRWEARGGDVFKVSIHMPDTVYQWRTRDGLCWRGNGAYWNGERPSQYDLVRYLGPIELSPTPACADQAGTPVVSTVSTGTAGDTLRMMRAEYNALDRWLSAYRHLVAVNERAKDDLEYAISKLEKEVEG